MEGLLMALRHSLASLNPYYNGRYSWSSWSSWRLTMDQQLLWRGLNPYYNGRYSWSSYGKCSTRALDAVLILIIMEDTHGESLIIIHLIILMVLILIIMEDTHGDGQKGYMAYDQGAS